MSVNITTRCQYC